MTRRHVTRSGNRRGAEMPGEQPKEGMKEEGEEDERMKNGEGEEEV